MPGLFRVYTMLQRLLTPVIAAAALVAGLASTRMVRRYVVQGESMLQAYAPSDRLVVERFSLLRRTPRVGEVVVVKQPHSDGRLDLKRVFAGPGATVEVLYAPITLGANEWFVVGDNLDHSNDSRQLGPVTTADIVGRVWFRY